MTETELLQLLARGEDSRHQFKRDATNADFCAIQSCLAKTRAIKQGMMQELLTGRTRLLAPGAPQPKE